MPGNGKRSPQAEERSSRPKQSGYAVNGSASRLAEKAAERHCPTAGMRKITQKKSGKPTCLDLLGQAAYQRVTTFRPFRISALTFSIWRNEASCRSNSVCVRSS